MGRLIKNRDFLLKQKNFKRMKKIYAYFNPSEWESVRPSDPNLMLYLNTASIEDEDIYIKYNTDGQYREIIPVSPGVSNSGNPYLFAERENPTDGQPNRKYSIDKIENYLFKEEFLDKHFKEEQELSDNSVDINPSFEIEEKAESNNDVSQNQQVNEDVSQNQEENIDLPYDNQINILDTELENNNDALVSESKDDIDLQENTDSQNNVEDLR